MLHFSETRPLAATCSHLQVAAVFSTPVSLARPIAQLINTRPSRSAQVIMYTSVLGAVAGTRVLASEPISRLDKSFDQLGAFSVVQGIRGDRMR